MPVLDNNDDIYTSSSQYLSPSTSSPRKSPSRQSINGRRSTASLRGPSPLTHAEDDTANGRFSLAHELAVALMPEPSVGSKLLAEEFGIEYDEGAEGIDEGIHGGDQVVIDVEDPTFATSFTDEFGSQAAHATFGDDQAALRDHPPDEHDLVSENTAASVPHQEQDSMEVLAQNLESTDKFLTHLRRLDVDSGSSVAQQPALERIASDIIRHINETVRDREGQVRELLEYDREFRKILGEVGGSDVLGQLEELPPVEDLSEATGPAEAVGKRLDIVEEEPPSALSLSNDWELDPDRHLVEDDDEPEPIITPVKDSFPPPPPANGSPTPANTIPQLAHLRTFTSSLVTSLSTISEQAQVNGAATTEAGRKIRALKNKLGGWRTDSDSAERSRIRIERWEAGLADGDIENSVPATPRRSSVSRRIDGRKLVAEHLKAFEIALADAAVRTNAIMALS